MPCDTFRRSSALSETASAGISRTFFATVCTELIRKFLDGVTMVLHDQGQHLVNDLVILAS